MDAGGMKGLCQLKAMRRRVTQRRKRFDYSPLEYKTGNYFHGGLKGKLR